MLVLWLETRVLWRVSVPHFDFTLTARVSSQSHVTRGPRASTCSSVGRVSASWLTGTVGTQGGKALCWCWEGCAEGNTHTFLTATASPEVVLQTLSLPFHGDPPQPTLQPPATAASAFPGCWLPWRGWGHEAQRQSRELSTVLSLGSRSLGSWSPGPWVPWVPVPRVLGLLGPGFLRPRAPCSLACPSDSSLCVSVSRLSYIYKAQEL